MPDLLRYLESAVAATIVAAGVSLLFPRLAGNQNRPVWFILGGLLGVIAGSLTGLGLQRIHLGWPPATALQRFVLIVFPVVVLVELVIPWVRPKWMDGLRFSMVVLSGWVLLWNSSYMPAQGGRLPLGMVAFSLFAWSFLVGTVRRPMVALAARNATGIATFSVAAAMVTGGLLILLGGYLAGGMAAIALGCAIAGSASGVTGAGCESAQRSLLETSLVLLFGLLFLGRYFGKLPTSSGVLVLLSPVLAWGGEWMAFRNTESWKRTMVSLFLVALPLLLLTIAAFLRFRRELGPMM